MNQTDRRLTALEAAVTTPLSSSERAEYAELCAATIANALIDAVRRRARRR